jgi:5'-nucleotidase
MKVLISNDDGYDSLGIKALKKCLLELDFQSEIVLIAPDRNRSAASNSLTLLEPLRIKNHGNNIYSVNGTPTDCVHMGINGALDFKPDIVISGINDGANLGDDVLYSGTVAAATEGRFLGKPSIAISLTGNKHFATAAHVLVEFLQKYNQLKLDKNTIININVPDIPLVELKGIKLTRLGQRHCSEPVVKTKDPRGGDTYWVGPAGVAADASIGTDFYAVEHNYASITPLKIDLTNYQMHTQLAKFFDE